jgi:transposase
MQDMIRRLEKRLWGDQLTLTKPTIVMDRGIATHDNIEYLRGQGYPYIVIRREDERSGYEQFFRTGRETFTRINDRGNKSVYGDDNSVYVRKLEPKPGEVACKVLCISEGKAHKEQAIANTKERKRDVRFMEAIDNFNRSIKNKTIKKADKIEAKLLRIRSNHRLSSARYESTLQRDEAGVITKVAINARQMPPAEDKLYGCYVIETTHVELSETAIWNLYMTLTNVESAFRSMKEELGMRPVYHQTGERSAAHLNISVLSYHILATIKNLLRKQDDCRQWETLREELSTHTRSTVVIKDKDGNVYHTRVSGTPEDVHDDIYKKLGVIDPLKTVTSLVKSV